MSSIVNPSTREHWLITFLVTVEVKQGKTLTHITLDLLKGYVVYSTVSSMMQVKLLLFFRLKAKLIRFHTSEYFKVFNI